MTLELRSFPPYSPQYNPVEMVFSKVKAFFRSEFWKSPHQTDNFIHDAISSVIVPVGCERTR